ncbi:MAG: NTP transferase domain-containing protein [Bacteroidetes bacterium]|nr:NTP transferase domain-containing protein [Bacteroidota bacterium]
MNIRNVAIIQARMGSSRFPSKMLAELGGIPLLEWVIRRLNRATTLAQVVLATSDQQSDDVLVELAMKLGISVFRGSENDVLGRFADAARTVLADNVVRVCADNPFIDPDEVDRLVKLFLESPCDYAFNHQDRLNSKYADGFGAEMITNNLLQHINRIVTGGYHREHVTSFIWEYSSNFLIHAVPASDKLAYPELRFDVDKPIDLEYLQFLINLGVNINSSASQIIELAQLEIFKK